MTLTRRQFLSRSGLAVGSLLMPGTAMNAFAAVDPNKVLVTVFLRGAADGLNLVIPAGDSGYYDARPKVRIQPGDEIQLDGFFGLHPALAPLFPLYQSGDLAIVHAVGSHDTTRSHFDAQDYMQHASPGDKSVRDGWLNRYVARAGVSGCFGAIGMGSSEIEALAGAAETLSLRDAAQLSLPGLSIRRDGLEMMYAGGQHAGLSDGIDRALACLDPAALVGPSSTTGYPTSPLGDTMSNLAALIKADIGVHVAAVDHLGWDTHQLELNELDVHGADLAGSLAAFYDDLGSHASRTLVLVMTEFGRRVQDNMSGTDHGHGSVMFAIGGGVNGGQVYLKNDTWPGLAEQDLHEGRDLQVTTDFRDVFGEVMIRFLGLGSNPTRDVLLDYGVPPTKMLDLFL